MFIQDDYKWGGGVKKERVETNIFKAHKVLRIDVFHMFSLIRIEFFFSSHFYLLVFPTFLFLFLIKRDAVVSTSTFYMMKNGVLHTAMPL